MDLILKFLEGPLEGKAVTLRRSVTLGRQGTDIVLNDSKVSKIHAFINFNALGQWVLKDNNSRNGVRSQGTKLRSLPLEEGTLFSIGQSVVQCTFSRKSLDGPGPLVDAAFIQWLKRVESLVDNGPLTAEPLIPPVRLKVIQGPQLDEEWLLDYGPRAMGFASPDLCLYEQGLPQKVLQFFVQKGRPLLKTEFPEHVRINGEAATDRCLHHGDTLDVGSLKIRVEMDKK